MPSVMDPLLQYHENSCSHTKMFPVFIYLNFPPPLDYLSNSDLFYISSFVFCKMSYNWNHTISMTQTYFFHLAICICFTYVFLQTNGLFFSLKNNILLYGCMQVIHFSTEEHLVIFPVWGDYK